MLAHNVVPFYVNFCNKNQVIPKGIFVIAVFYFKLNDDGGSGFINLSLNGKIVIIFTISFSNNRVTIQGD